MEGALGLEPRAYGFGDDADKSASGELPFEVLISILQKLNTTKSVKNKQKTPNQEFLNQAYGLLCLWSVIPKPSALKLYHIIQFLSRFTT